MPTEPRKPLIVISYAHGDEPEKPAEGEVKWLSFVTGYLRPAIKHGAVDLWLDRLMLGGVDWEREIGDKLRACDIFILLVSRHSLSSDYVVDKEIALIRERQARRELVHFYPLVLTPTPDIALQLVKDKNLRPRDGKSLSDFSLNERSRHLNEAANEIAAIAEEIAGRPNSLPMSQSGNSPEVGERPTAVSRIQDEKSLGVWLAGQRRAVWVAIAARAALRVAPLAGSALEERPSPTRVAQIIGLISANLRATALARVVAKYPARENELRDAHAADAAMNAAYRYQAQDRQAAAAARAPTRAENAPNPAAAFAAKAAFVREGAGDDAAIDAAHRAAAADAFDAARAAGAAASWEEVRADAAAIIRAGGSASAVADSALWSRNRPEWARRAWAALRAALPKGEDWSVWIDWYEERLRGGSRGEDYEFVFASVPQEQWDKGPAAANAWIKTHLPKPPEPPRPVGLPDPLPNLDAPLAYGWNTALRVEIIAGAQNLPFYTHFSSEEDHRKALEACRVGAERLLKSLRAGRWNARPEYGEALEYYLDDLPRTAGAGNILLANDQARILHAMFLADAEMLPEGFASRLKSVIANQFALNAFYDLVQRHNEAVIAGNWSQPFPLDATKSFFNAVAGSTPRWFEREVEKGLRQVEQAEPPPAAAPPEPAPASAIEPPPLPPGTPDAQDSWRRQMATAANALWETFLQGQNMPVDREEWRKAADELGEHVRPVIDFLREQEEGKT